MESPPGEYLPCPLQFYDFQQLDNKGHCPIYTTILEHPGDSIALEELDSLHSELLAMQANTQNRIQLLESELGILDGWQVKRDYRKRKHSDTSDTGPLRAHNRQPDAPPPKKQQRVEMGRKSKHTKVQEGYEEGGAPEHSMPKAKGDTPDRFWSSVEPYCSDITEADMRMLQEGIRSYDDDSELYQVPPIGQHFSRRWAVEDLKEERGEAAKLALMAESGSRAAENGGWQEESDALLKQAESMQSEDKEKSHYGPLTQQLIAAFLEDPVGGKLGRPPSRRLSPPVNAPHVDTLESRIREELIALGLIEPQEQSKGESEGDEVLDELLKKQSEFKAVCDYNQQQRQTLYSLAKAEMKRQEVRQQANEVDLEVMEWLRRFTGYKQKRKAPSRKEKEAARRTLELRDTLYQKLT